MKQYNEIPWNVYKELLPKAEAIFDSIYPKATSTAQIAERFNKVGDIIWILWTT